MATLMEHERPETKSTLHTHVRHNACVCAPLISISFSIVCADVAEAADGVKNTHTHTEQAFVILRVFHLSYLNAVKRQSLVHEK